MFKLSLFTLSRGSIVPDIEENLEFGVLIEINDPGLVRSLNSKGIVESLPWIVGEFDLLGKENKGKSSFAVEYTQSFGASVIFKINVSF